MRSRASRGRPLAALILLAVCSTLGCGCASGYVLRAAYEEARLLWRRQPIDRVLAGEVDPTTRDKLELTLRK